jgi:hypothetical protein
VIVTASALLVVSCATSGFYETARTTPKGKFEFGGSITPVYVYATADTLLGQTSGFVFFPVPELAVKYGLGSDLDIGARWGFGPGISGNVKYRLLRGDHEAAIAAAGSFYGLSLGGVSGGSYDLTPRLVYSTEAKGSLPYEASLGLRMAGAFGSVLGMTVSTTTLSAVVSAGMPFRLGASRGFRLTPELSASIPFLTTYQGGGYSNSGARVSELTINLGVGLSSVAREE